MEGYNGRWLAQKVRYSAKGVRTVENRVYDTEELACAYCSGLREGLGSKAGHQKDGSEILVLTMPADFPAWSEAYDAVKAREEEKERLESSVPGILTDMVAI